MQMFAPLVERRALFEIGTKGGHVSREPNPVECRTLFHVVHCVLTLVLAAVELEPEADDPRVDAVGDQPEGGGEHGRLQRSHRRRHRVRVGRENLQPEFG